MPAINNITLAEIQEYYPVTDSLAQAKINMYMNYVKNITFLAMFGNFISAQIFDGTIEDSASNDFIGFRKFVAMCIADRIDEEVHTHTNAGLKTINQPNWSTPKTSEKTQDLMDLRNAVENQFFEAKKILKTLDQTPENDYQANSSFQIDRI